MGFWRWLTATEETPERRDWSIGDPAFADWISLSGVNPSGITVTETSALAATAVYRCVALISGVVASLPLKTYRTLADDTRERVKSFLDTPAGPESLTAYEWKETVLLHLLLHGNAYLLHRYNGAGALIGLTPVHPRSVGVERAADIPGGKLFRVTVDDGTTREFTAVDLTHVPALSTDGLRGYAPLAVARNAIGTALAGDRAAANTFGKGPLIAGLVTPEDDITEEEGEVIKAGLRAKLGGSENAGELALVNRRLKFSPWAMTNQDAQFLESRAFQVEEIARLFGVPPHLLGQTEKQTSWGTGLTEQNRGLARYTLMPWTSRLEERLSVLLPAPRFVGFDYKGLLEGSPAEEIDLLLAQTAGGLLTLDEARRVLDRPPLDLDVAAAEAELTEGVPVG
jgi:HK97 family phage portal protein